MSSLKLWSFLSVALFALAGCGMLKKKQPDPAASAAPLVVAPVATPAVPTAAPAPAEVTVADESVPAPEDFEDEAFEKVSAKTYKVELESLKKEIETP